MAYERNRQAGLRHRQRRWWPLAAAFWMAIGLSPCAVASVANLDCGHCPETVAASDHAGYAGGHGSGHAGHTGHDAAAGSGHRGCADGDCLDSDDTLVDQRGAGKAGKSTGDIVFLPAAPAVTMSAAAVDRQRSTDPPSAPPMPNRRMHLVHCVFLD